MTTGDTIAAISTPAGEGAIALLRVSGPDALPILGRILRASGSKEPYPPRFATLGRIVDGDAVVDQVLATVFRAPSSYTGEDMVEIACHGGVLLPARILELIFRAGARASEPGEFTRRAFLNGKMDLTRAEAVMDIIRARTPLALRAAAEQLEGRLGDEIFKLRERLLVLVANHEAWIDFPEEGIDPASGIHLAEKIQESLDGIHALLATANGGRVLREGVRLAIVGRPNVGKSSLLNRLLGMDRAIVSDRPGTTRDTIEETACFHGILFRLTDTAGLRESDDPVEREGVERSRRSLEEADIVLHVTAVDGLEIPEEMTPKEILVVNKSDLLPDGSQVPSSAISVSSLTGAGISDLLDAVVLKVGGGHLNSGPTFAAINARHKVLLESAAAALETARELTLASQPPEIAAIELRTALDDVGRIVGAADIEEILGQVFSSFCIGK